MSMFEFDEFAAGASAWYKDVVKAIEDNDGDLAKELAQAALSKKREAAGCLALANACLAINDTAQAKCLAEEASSLGRKEKAKMAEAAAEHVLAKILVRGNKFGEAEQTLKTSMNIYNGAKNEAGRASVLITLSRCKKDTDVAMDTVNEAVGTFKKLGNSRGTASAMFAIINIKLSSGHSDHAPAVADEIVAHFEQEKDADGVAAAQLLKAQVFMAIGQVQDAVGPVLAATESCKDAKKKARAATQMANILRSLGLFADAHKAADAAAALSRDAGDKRGQAAALCMAATICDSEGDHGKAAYKLERAAKFYKQLKDPKEEAQTLEAMASMQLKVVSMLDDPKEPEKVCRKAMNLYKSIGMEQSAECGHLMQTLAFALLAQGQPQDALQMLEESLDIFRAIGNARGEAAGCNKMAQVYWSQGEVEDAKKFAGKGARIAQESGDKDEAAWANQLVKDFAGGKQEGQKNNEDKRSNAQKVATSHTDSKHNIWMYATGRDYFIVFEGTWRGAPAAAQGTRGRRSSSKDQSADQQGFSGSIQQSVMQIDWQALGRV